MSLQISLELALDRFRLDVSVDLSSHAAVLGPSGAGKSSLLESILGLRRARGRVAVGGEVLQDENRFLPPQQRGFGWVPQDALLFPHLSVRQNLGFALAQPPSGEKLEEVAIELGLAELLERSPRHLSGGERRRVALGRALLAEPRWLLLDEPTQGLDPASARRVLGVLRGLRSRHSYLVVTHRREEALALADEVLLLERGQLQAQGPARRLLLGAEATSRFGGERWENLVAARVSRHDSEGGVTRVELESGVEISIPPAFHHEIGSELVLAIDAEELLVSIEAPRGLSARNILSGSIDRCVTEGRDVFVRVGEWWAHLTPAAVSSLGLAPGKAVWLVAKTHSWRVVAEEESDRVFGPLRGPSARSACEAPPWGPGGRTASEPNGTHHFALGTERAKRMRGSPLGVWGGGLLASQMVPTILRSLAVVSCPTDVSPFCDFRRARRQRQIDPTPLGGRVARGAGSAVLCDP